MPSDFQWGLSDAACSIQNLETARGEQREVLGFLRRPSVAETRRRGEQQHTEAVVIAVGMARCRSRYGDEAHRLAVRLGANGRRYGLDALLVLLVGDRVAACADLGELLL